MDLIIIVISSLAFLLMGIVGLAQPQRITQYFDVHEIPKAMQNEVRAVYGGFGVAIAGLLLIVSFDSYSALRVGVCLTVSIALLGMVFGRVVSFAIHRTMKRVLVVFLLKELTLGVCLMFLVYKILSQ